MNHLKMFKQMLDEFQFIGFDGEVTRTGWRYREEVRENEILIEPAQPLGSTLRFYFDLDGRLIDMVPRTNPMNLHC